MNNPSLRGGNTGQSQSLGSRRSQATSPRGQGQPSLSDRHAPEALFPSWPTPCLRISLAPGCHLCCRHEVVSTPDTFPFHQPSVSAAAGLQRSATVPGGARDRHFRQLKLAAISERPARRRLCSSPSARPEQGLEPVFADWREEGGMKHKTQGRRMRDGG